MAGIGLTLRKLLDDQTYLHGSVAYFWSGVIVAGPWMISVITLAMLQGATNTFLAPDDRSLLVATITYVIIASSILTGPIQIVVTRVIADHLFLEEYQAIAPAFLRMLTVSAVGLCLLILPVMLWMPFPLSYSLLAGSLFVTVSLTWLALAVLSSAEDYLSIAMAFLIGFAISGGLCMGLGRLFGPPGGLAGFALGQAICLAMLSRRILHEFPQTESVESKLDHSALDYWRLAMIGLLYYGGLWADKLLFWFSPDSTLVHSFFRTFPAYDSAGLVAYLLTIPASAVFLINLETRFYEHYHAYFQFILGGRDKRRENPARGTLEEIVRARLAMKEAAQSGYWTLIKVQGMVAIFACLIADDLLRLLGLPAESAIFRPLVLAASGQVFVLYAVLLLLYVDAQREALAVAAVFAASNVGLSGLELALLPGSYGLGYLISTLIASLVGAWRLNAVLTGLDYTIFMLQPLETNTSSSDHPRQGGRSRKMGQPAA